MNIFGRGFIMKRMLYIAAVAVIAASTVLGGCSAVTGSKKQQAVKQESAYERIQDTLIKMQTYESNASVQYISNKGSNVYSTLQQCKSSGEYRVEVTGPENVSGNITVSDGKVICQFNTRLAGKVSVGTKENQERNEIFLTTFVKNYVKSHEVSISVSNIGKSSYTVLEAIVPGNHPYLASEKLWVDNETLKPSKLVIYDPDGGERVIVTYETFTYNVTLDDSLFKI